MREGKLDLLMDLEWWVRSNRLQEPMIGFVIVPPIIFCTCCVCTHGTPRIPFPMLRRVVHIKAFFRCVVLQPKSISPVVNFPGLVPHSIRIRGSFVKVWVEVGVNCLKQ